MVWGGALGAGFSVLLSSLPSRRPQVRFGSAEGARGERGRGRLPLGAPQSPVVAGRRGLGGVVLGVPWGAGFPSGAVAPGVPAWLAGAFWLAPWVGFLFGLEGGLGFWVLFALSPLFGSPVFLR